MKADFFSIKSDADFPKLKEWLRGRPFNETTKPTRDKYGKPIIGLRMTERGKQPVRVGLVWMVHERFEADVRNILSCHRLKPEDFGKDVGHE